MKYSIILFCVLAYITIVMVGILPDSREKSVDGGMKIEAFDNHNGETMVVTKESSSIKSVSLKDHLSYILVGMLIVIAINYLFEYIFIKEDLSNFYLFVLFLAFAGHIVIISPMIINIFSLTDLSIFKVHIITEIVAVTLLGSYVELSMNKTKHLRNQTRQLLNLMFIILLGTQSEFNTLITMFYIWNGVLILELVVQLIGPYRECKDKLRVLFIRAATVMWIACVMNDIIKYLFYSREVSNHRRYGYLAFLVVVIMFKIKSSKKWKMDIKESKESLEEIVMEKSGEILMSRLELVEVNKKLKESLEELERKDKMLLRSEKLAVLGEFAGEITHEIKNPLSAILTTSSLLRMDIEEVEGENRESMEECIDIIEEASKRSKDIIMNILNYSRMESDVELERIELSKVINSVNMLVQRELERLEIEFLIEQDETIMINGKNGELTQVILNIINNSKDAVMEKVSGEKKISIRAFKEGKMAIVEIKDSGIGMTEEELKNMTKPYFTTKEEGKGTGLGMSISYQILERHNAKLEVTSIKGEGSKFTIIFKEI